MRKNNYYYYYDGVPGPARGGGEMGKKIAVPAVTVDTLRGGSFLAFWE